MQLAESKVQSDQSWALLTRPWVTESSCDVCLAVGAWRVSRALHALGTLPSSCPCT